MLLPPPVRGKVALVVTSPPYGPSTHGHVRTPGPRRGKVRKLHHRYGGSDNLAYRDHDTLAAGFTEILAGCRAVLHPGGHVSFETSPYCGEGQDNIYTALTKEPLDPKTHPPANGVGFVGRNLGAAWNYDSYLVPTDQDLK